MSEILSCPFCGETATEIIDDPNHGDDAWHAIQCMSCECKTDYFSKLETAIAMWNTRTNKAEQILKRLKQYLEINVRYEADVRALIRISYVLDKIKELEQ